MILLCPDCGKTWPDDYDAACCDCGYEIDRMFPERKRGQIMSDELRGNATYIMEVANSCDGDCHPMLVQMALAAVPLAAMYLDADKARQGWREFKCSCGLHWAEPTRDRLSPSLECCPKCSNECFPLRQWPDVALAVDNLGNLATHPVTAGKEPPTDIDAAIDAAMKAVEGGVTT